MIGLSRSSLQHQPARKDDDALRFALIRLTKQYGRYGYRKIAELLRIEGWKVNHKKVERIWREEGLQLPQRHKKRRRLYHKDSSIIRLRPTHPNHVWSIDFVHDKLCNGRSYKMLTVLDEYTRQALAVAVRTRMGADDVLEALYPLLLRHGTPEYIRSDNGPEFVAQAMQDWLAGSVSSLSGSISGHPGRKDTTNDLTELCAARCSMPNGSTRQSRLRSSSTSGSDSTITSAHTRPSTCALLFQKL